jgi:predicted TIM-barrel fold metal-dependent hydrolase
MTYTGGRPTLDADSHIMELPGFLDPFIESSMLEKLHERSGRLPASMFDKAKANVQARRDDAGRRSEAEERLLLDKGWSAMGAFDPAERSHVVDLLGVEAQLVFATVATALFMGKDIDLLYAGSAAHNRALTDFCKDDARLLPVAFIPLVDTDRAVALLEESIELGCGAIHVPSTAAGDRGPTHPDLDPFWSLLNDSGIPFVLHVGGGGRLLDRRFHDNGRPVTDHLGGGENIRSKDYMVLHNPPEIFIAAMVLDGVFEKFPGLMCGVIEQGALWVPALLRRIDIAQGTFKKSEPLLAELPMTASDYIRRQVRFTPFPTEPVGWLIEQAGEELFLFSSDYPHPEGTKDPLGRFESSLEGTNDEARDRFYSGNFAELFALSA